VKFYQIQILFVAISMNLTPNWESFICKRLLSVNACGATGPEVRDAGACLLGHSKTSQQILMSTNKFPKIRRSGQSFAQVSETG
jgi:hypothetical protein